MIWDAGHSVLEVLMGVFSNKADKDLPEVREARREAEREAARERSRKAAGL